VSSLNGGYYYESPSQFFSQVSTNLDNWALLLGAADLPIAVVACGLTMEAACLGGVAAHGIIQTTEAAVSWASTGASALSDIFAGRTGYDPTTHTFVIGQDTWISFVASAAGTVGVDPVTDNFINATLIGYDSARANGLGPNAALMITLDPAAWHK
jgi:hypothetical protein